MENGFGAGLENLREQLAQFAERIRQLNRIGENLATLQRRVGEIIAAGFRRPIADEFGEAAADVFSLRALLREGSNVDHLNAHLDVLAKGLATRWRPYGQAARIALRDRALANDQSVDEEKVDLARVGLLLAATDLDRPQTIRLGTRWVVDDAGRQVEIPPSELMFGWAIRWYASAAKAAMSATLLDEPWPRPAEDGDSLAHGQTVPLDEAIHIADVTPSPLDDLIYDEKTTVMWERISGSDLPAALRNLLDAYFYTGDWLEAAEHLGISPSTMRKRKQRLYEAISGQDP